MSNNPKRYRGKYHIESNRLKDWDYGSPGYYFVTICTHNKVSWFGEIRAGQMLLSAAGIVVTEELEKTGFVRQNTKIDIYVVMPNHIHAIIQLKDSSGGAVETPRRGVSTNGPWQSGALGAIVNQIKSTCTKRIRSIGYDDFAWQPGYYDHIIRSEKSLENIQLYIFGNPAKWDEDEYFKK